ncbi:MAG: hypothetical protein CMP53_08365 [Flavobacteriales bacterium]|jgi:hypothetical protein|nr:hypothetical protein [Flavobacteriales bacterium]|tara:strand:+ start:1188 stop:2108 length:921 start_codon:yes stop_codon:yes gene_type:complete
MKKANLFLIGAAKAGTTALSELLTCHEEVSGMAIKEPGHFCTDIYERGFSKEYQNLLRWSEKEYFERDFEKRHMSFIEEVHNYDKLVQNTPQSTYILDASTAYLPSVNAAENVAQYNPNAKIIVCLRNPITRAYSHFNMALKYGKEQRTFLEAVKAESTLKARWGWEEGYLEWGLYAPQVKRWLKHFATKQVLIIWQEKMLFEPSVVHEEIEIFLGLNSKFKAPNNSVHESEVPRSKIASTLIGSFGPKVASVLPHVVKQKVKGFVLSKPDSMNKEASSFLLRYFAPSINELEALLNKDLTHWKEI